MVSLEEKIKIIDFVPEEARLDGYGLDFGYSIDPTAIDAIYKWNDSYVIDEVVHKAHERHGFSSS